MPRKAIVNIGCSVVLCMAAAAVWAAVEPVISKETALRAIMIFRADPFSEEGRAARAVIVAFGDQSKDVVVKLSRKAAPFMGKKRSDLSLDDMSTLLVAFAAGNIDSQLLRHQTRDDSYSGDLQVIETYRQMQKRKPGFRLPEIEKLIELEKRGQLKAYLAKE